MKQTQLISAGCQVANPFLLIECKSRFAYCSTVAVYIYDTETYQLTSVLAAHNYTITGMDWSPKDINRLVTCSADLRVIQWRLTTCQPEREIQLKVAPRTVEYAPDDSNIVLILDCQGEIHLWNPLHRKSDPPSLKTSPSRLSKLRGSSSEIEGLKHVPLRATITRARWYPARSNQSNYILAGTNQGNLLRVSSTTGKSTRLFSKLIDSIAAVIDFQWDPRSITYLLVSLSTGNLLLVDMETNTLVQSFEAQAHEFCFTWNRLEPGSFITATTATPLLVHWNVSQKVAGRRTKLKDALSGVKTIRQSLYYPLLYMSFRNGKFAIFDQETNHICFSTEPGHSETIFDCQFHPSNPDIFATCSFDRSVKIWNFRKGSFLKEMRMHGIIYSVAFAPHHGDIIACSTSRGKIYFWNVTTGLLERSVSYHSKECYRIAWGLLHWDLLLSTSSDGTAVISHIDGRQLNTFRHPAPVFGCDWHKFRKHTICTGCSDGLIRVFDITKNGKDAVKLKLEGHQGRVFNTVWSPLLADVLCSGSDDKTVRVFDISQTPYKSYVLRGHQDKVRALVWHTEFPYILCSGSWDGTIRVWDFRTEQCLRVARDHHADVYGLTSHPMRPFTFISSSRDSTLRIWSMEIAEIQNLRIRLCSKGPDEFEHCLGTLDQAMGQSCTSSTSGTPEATQIVMCGEASGTILKLVQSSRNKHEAMSICYQFFDCLPGLHELWNVSLSMIYKFPARSEDKIIHQSLLLDTYAERAQTLYGGKGLGFQGGKRKERLQEAADLYLMLGRIEQYCDIMIELGNWDRAIAVAPRVSLEFWKSLCMKRADAIQSENENDSVIYRLMCREFRSAIRSQLVSGEDEHASIIAAAVDAEGSANEIFQNDASDAEHLTGEEPSQNTTSPTFLKETMIHRAHIFYERGSAILAAASLLSVGEINAALNVLVRANEMDLACALVIVLDPPATYFIFDRMVDRAIDAKMWQTAVELASKSKTPYLKLRKIRLFYHGNLSDQEFCSRYRISTRTIHTTSMTSTKYEDLIRQAIDYLNEKNYQDAVTIACTTAREILDQNLWSLEQVIEVLDVLWMADLKQVDLSIREDALSLTSYVGALRAARRGYIDVVPALFRNCMQMAEACGKGYPVPRDLLILQELQYTHKYFPSEAVTKLSQALSLPDIQDCTRNAIQTIKKSIEDVISSGKNSTKLLHFKSSNHRMSGFLRASLTGRTSIIQTGSQLPSGHNAYHQTRSKVTGRIIKGPPLYITSDFCLSMTEALMWVEVNPFSPLNDGSLFNPY